MESSSSSSSSFEKINPKPSVLLQTSLQEKLEHCASVHSSSSFSSEQCTIQKSFYSFLKNGLAAFLSHPLSLQEVDLVHLIAMVVSPTPPTSTTLFQKQQQKFVGDGLIHRKHGKNGASTTTPKKNNQEEDTTTTKKEEDEEEEEEEMTKLLKEEPYVNQALQFMTCYHSHYFSISDEDRMYLVRMLCENLVIPESTFGVVGSSGERQDEDDEEEEEEEEEEDCEDTEDDDEEEEEEDGEEDRGSRSRTTTTKNTTNTSSSAYNQEKNSSWYNSATSFSSSSNNNNNNNNKKKKDTPLFLGAVPHLRSSLQSFEHYVMPYDYNYAAMARQTLVNIAVQSGRESLVKDEFDDLLFLLVNDCVDYGGCRKKTGDGTTTTNSKRITNGTSTSTSSSSCSSSCCCCCPHATRGEAMQNLITRYNESRYYYDPQFTRRVLILLTDSLGNFLQLLSLSRDDDDDDNHDGDGGGGSGEKEKKKMLLPTSCQIVSLLKAARSLFYFLLPLPCTESDDYDDNDQQQQQDEDDDEEEESNSNEEGPKEEAKKKKELIYSSVQFLCHDNVGVVSASSDLLALAFAYGCQKKNNSGDGDGDDGRRRVVVMEDESYARSVYESVEMILLKNVFQKVKENEDEEEEEENPNGGGGDDDKYNVKNSTTTLDEMKKKKKNNAFKLRKYHQKLMKALCPVIVATSRLSQRFADSLLSFLFEQVDDRCRHNNDNDNNNLYAVLLVVVFRLVSFIALAQPASVSIRVIEIQNLLSKFWMRQHSKENGGSGAMIADIVAACLSCKMATYSISAKYVAECETFAHFLLFHDEDTTSAATTTTIATFDAWTLFQLARHAYSTANFGIAHELFDKRLLSVSSTETSYLWLSALSKSAKAEDVISKEGVLGVTHASLLLDSAIAHIQSLSLLRSASNGGTDGVDEEPFVDNPFSFQLHLLHHRLDFLNLCVTTRGLCAEMKLTGDIPAKGTRSFLHQRNACHCFYALAKRYLALYTVHGIMHTQQTRTALRMLYTLCRFMGDAVSKVFAEAVAGGGVGSRLCRSHSVMESAPVGDFMHPASNLMQILKENVIRSMGDSIDPILRAPAMIQVLDAILKCPVPYPRGFLEIKPPPMAELHMSAHPASTLPVRPEEGATLDGMGSSEDEAEVVDVLPGFSCTVYVSGKIPCSYFEKSGLSFSQVVVRHTVQYDGPLDSADGDDQDGGEEQQSEVDGAGGNNDDENSTNLSADGGEGESGTDNAVATALLPNGRFIVPLKWDAPSHREGYYKMQAKLECRDVRFAEWEIPTQPNAGTIFLCVKPRGDDEDEGGAN